jgi:hypothetical protein
MRVTLILSSALLDQTVRQSRRTLEVLATSAPAPAAPGRDGEHHVWPARCAVPRTDCPSRGRGPAHSCAIRSPRICTVAAPSRNNFELVASHLQWFRPSGRRGNADNPATDTVGCRHGGIGRLRQSADDEWKEPAELVCGHVRCRRRRRRGWWRRVLIPAARWDDSYMSLRRGSRRSNLGRIEVGTSRPPCDRGWLVATLRAMPPRSRCWCVSRRPRTPRRGSR